MKINKRCLSTFSKTKPFLALGTKSKLFDTTFSLTSELSLYDYSTDTHYPTLQLDRKFSKLLWCEKKEKSVLATGHDNGMVSLYEPHLEGASFRLLNSYTGLEGDVLGLDFNVSKNVLAAGSANGKIIFWNLDKIDQQYKCDIAINANITSLAWNKKVSRILCAGTDDGRILVLDIRAKNIAMTLENPEIKTVSSVAWHPKCPTSIFASTNMPFLHSFNLSTDSMSTVGDHRVLGFDILNEDTLVSYSKERVNYVDVDSLMIRGSEEVEGLFEASFSHKDPLSCLSSSNGFTTLCSRRDSSILPSTSQTVLGNHLVASSTFKIEYPKLSSGVRDDLSHTVMKLIYEDGKFNLGEANRKEVASLILADCKKSNAFSEGELDLNDSLVENLVRHNFEGIQRGAKELDIKFVLDLLLKKPISCEGSSIEFLLYLFSTGEYEKVIESLPVSQWKVMVCILLFSSCSLEKCVELFKEIDKEMDKEINKEMDNDDKEMDNDDKEMDNDDKEMDKDDKKMDKDDRDILLLLTNNPKDLLDLTSLTKSIPKSIFELNDFFSGFIPVVEKIKSLRIETDKENKFIEEFISYAKDHGMFDLVKDLKPKASVKPCDLKLEGLTLNPKKVPSTPHTPINSTFTSPAPPKQLYSSPFNLSVSSFTPPVEQNTPPVSGRPNLRPPIKTSPQGVKSTVPTPLKPTGFSTRPPSLYSCSSSGSTPSFVSKPRKENVPGTYGNENTYENKTYENKTLSTPPLPDHGVRKPIPKPSQSFLKPTPITPKPVSSPPVVETNYDASVLSNEFEKVFEKLKEDASKKNNLIIGNKIKDANRRFSVFLSLDKQSLSKNVLYRMSLLVQTFKEVTEKDLVKQSVKLVVEECADLQENQCNIWMPAIFTLVQLVY